MADPVLAAQLKRLDHVQCDEGRRKAEGKRHGLHAEHAQHDGDVYPEERHLHDEPRHHQRQHPLGPQPIHSLGQRRAPAAAQERCGEPGHHLSTASRPEEGHRTERSEQAHSCHPPDCNHRRQTVFAIS